MLRVFASRIGVLALFVFLSLTLVIQQADAQASSYPCPGRKFTTLGNITITGVPIGSFCLFLVDGGGLSLDSNPTLTASFTVADPAFTIEFAGCVSNGSQYNCWLDVAFRPTDTVQHCATVVSDLRWKGSTRLPQTVRLCGTGAPSPRVQLAINNVRVGQRVFDPSSTNGATTDLVTKKPFAVEVTLSATFPPQHANLLAQAKLYVGDQAPILSDSFQVGDIVNGQSKVFMFSEMPDAALNKELRIEVGPVTETPNVFDSASIVRDARVVNFYETKLSLLTVNFAGCAPAEANCFVPPTSAELGSMRSEHLPFLESFLPISGGGLVVTAGNDERLSQPSTGNALAIDAIKLWTQKKTKFQNAAVGVVGNDYFIKNGLATPTLGFWPLGFKGLVFYKPVHAIPLAHELVHSLGIPVHSMQPFAEGVGLNRADIWTTGVPLDAGPAFLPEGPNAMADSINTNVSALDFTIDRGSYNTAFSSLQLNVVDPQVILVAGVLGQAGNSTHLEMTRTLANLDEPLATSDIKIEGLDSSGAVVSFVNAQSTSSGESISEDGLVEEFPLNGTLYVGTLPDNGTVKTIRVTRSGTVLFTKAIDAGPVSLEAALKGLTTSAFKAKGLAASIVLALVQAEYIAYRKLLAKGKIREAKIALLALRATLKITLKPQFTLKDGFNMTVSDILGLVDKELATFK